MKELENYNKLSVIGSKKLILRLPLSLETVIGITADKHCIFFFRNYF